jgi:hypothetical protein
MKTPAALNRGEIFKAAGAVTGLVLGLLLTLAPCDGQIVNPAQR